MVTQHEQSGESIGEEKVAAGGVVYKYGEAGIEVVVCCRKIPLIHVLPKGTPDRMETMEQVALREVNEETGLRVDIEAFIQAIDYWFSPSSQQVQYHKTVYFYLMRPRGGDVTMHDHEFDEVSWVPVEEALKTLTYGNEVKVVQKSLSMVT